MAKTEIILQVFVGSPGDVKDERIALEEVIRELNSTWNDAFDIKISLDLIKWETDASASSASAEMEESLQDAIYEQILNSYDIFIAIFWDRLGNQISRAKPGIVEEFNRAYKRYKVDPNSIEIMVYFKETPIKPSQIDHQQIKEVSDFKSRVARLGFSFEFDSTESFRKLVRKNLDQKVKKWVERYNGNPIPQSETQPIVEENLQAADELNRGSLQSKKEMGKVFISYSHDSNKHKNSVLEFSNLLREYGIDAVLDQYEISPPEGWPKWMELQIKRAEFIIIICTENYWVSVEEADQNGNGLGVYFESTLTYHHIYFEKDKNKRFIPVIFNRENFKYIPSILKGFTSYCVDNGQEARDLYRRLKKQPITQKPELGKKEKLIPEDPKAKKFARKLVELVNRTNKAIKTGNSRKTKKTGQAGRIVKLNRLE